MQTEIFKSLIAKRLILYVVLASSVLTLVSTCYYVYRKHHAQLNQVQGNLELFKNSYLPALRNEVWIYNYNQVEVLLTGALGLQYFANISIEVDQQEVVSVGTRPEGVTIDSTFPLTRQYNDATLQFGTVHIFIDKDLFDKSIRAQALVLLTQNGIVIFLSATFLLIAFHFVIGKRLFALTSRLSKLEIDSSDEPLTDLINTSRKEDEIDQVIAAIVLMRGKITDQLKQVKESEEKFRVTFTTSPDAIMLTRARDGVYIDVNEGYERLSGYQREEAIGNTSLKLNSWKNPEDRDTFVNKLAERGFVENLESEFLTKKGETIYALMSARIVEIDGEKAILSIARDITPRKLAEEKYQTLINEASIGICIADANSGKILECNNAFANMLEYQRAELIGQYPSKFEGGQTIDGKITAGFAEHRDTAYGEVRERALTTKHGKGLNVDVKATRVKISNQDLMVGFFQDITSKKKAEDHRQELEQQLRQKYKMEAIGVMAGGIAHNFNNSLAAILGSLEMARRKLAQPEKVKGYLQMAAKATIRSRDLVSQILAYSQQNSNQQTPTDISQVTEETLQLLKSTLPATIQLDYQPPAEQPLTVFADGSRIQETLLNLCNNAVQAMNEEGVLRIELKQVELEQEDIPAGPVRHRCPPGPYAQIVVSDTGCGIDQQILGKIFDPFFTTKGVGEGTGMGLSTVQGIVDQHGGMIRVQSEPGQGATFALYFPRIDAEPVIVPHEETKNLPRGKENILFIDDDRTLADLGRHLLAELGYQVTVAVNSADALNLFASNPAAIDLVITDQTMPGLTGKELITELKKIDPAVRTILATGYSTKINGEEAKKMGIDAFCLKPLNLTELAQTVRLVLDRTG